jgi:hypothetical protein
MRLAAPGEGSTETGVPRLRRDTDPEDAGALRALVADRRPGPADELTAVFGGPIAAVCIRRFYSRRMSQPSLGYDALPRVVAPDGLRRRATVAHDSRRELQVRSEIEGP